MARQPGKGQATPPTAARKPGKDVISQSIEVSSAKVADLGDAVQKSAAMGAARIADTADANRPPKISAKGRKGPPTHTAGAPIVKQPEATAPSSAPAEPIVPQSVEAAVSSSHQEPAIVAETSEPPAPIAENDVHPAQPAAAPEPIAAEPLQSHQPAIVAASSDAPEAVAGEGVRPTEPVAPPEPGTLEPVAAAPTPEMVPTEPMPAVASYASYSVRQSMDAAVDGLTAFNCKTIAAFRTNAGMTFDLVRSLIGVKSVAEAILIHTEHARHQFEVMSTQARELHALARKVTTEVAAPLSKELGRTIGGA